MTHMASLQDMVAYLYPGGRPTSARQTTSDMRHTAVKLVPRQGITAAWRDQLMDACNVHGCSRLLDEAEPPAFDAVLAQTPPTCDLQTARQLHQMATDEWRVENTVLYHVLRGSITLTGAHEESDLHYIHSHFIHGDERDGRGLFEWLLSFKSHNTVGAQAALIAKVEAAKLSTGQPSLSQLEVHCTDLLNNWSRIAGNDVRVPWAFYFRLLRSISHGSEGSKLGALHQWMAAKVAEQDPVLTPPAPFLQDKLMTYAATLGMPESGDQVTAIGRTGNCKHCPSRLCKSNARGGAKSNCLCFNPKTPIPATASDGERSFVATCREYVKLFSPSTLSNLGWAHISAKVKEAKDAGGKNTVKVVDKDASSSSASDKTSENGEQAAAEVKEQVAAIAANGEKFEQWWQMVNGKAHRVQVVTPRTYKEAVSGPFGEQWKASMATEMAKLPHMVLVGGNVTESKSATPPVSEPLSPAMAGDGGDDGTRTRGEGPCASLDPPDARVAINDTSVDISYPNPQPWSRHVVHTIGSLIPIPEEGGPHEYPAQWYLPRELDEPSHSMPLYSTQSDPVVAVLGSEEAYLATDRSDDADLTTEDAEKEALIHSLRSQVAVLQQTSVAQPSPPPAPVAVLPQSTRRAQLYQTPGPAARGTNMAVPANNSPLLSALRAGALNTCLPSSWLQGSMQNRGGLLHPWLLLHPCQQCRIGGAILHVSWTTVSRLASPLPRRVARKFRRLSTLHSDRLECSKRCASSRTRLASWNEECSQTFLLRLKNTRFPDYWHYSTAFVTARSSKYGFSPQD